MGEIKKITEQDSKYNNLEEMSISELLVNINNEDKSVPLAIEKSMTQIEALVEKVVQKLKNGGRIFYIGAGTSGRLGVVDASECPPTYGVPHDLVNGIIAGGDSAIRKAVEFAEDDVELGWQDLCKHKVNSMDIVIGIAASGTTPYTVGALKKCRENRIVTGCITCNYRTPLAQNSDFPIEVIVGPEFVTGSTRMKAGTAQKLVLNMISTTSLVKIGRVKGNKMVDMQLSNNKLIDRGIRMLMEKLSINEKVAKDLLRKYGTVRRALEQADINDY
jgi:N-acetylmuramic acid 6-phosphate etherase